VTVAQLGDRVTFMCSDTSKFEIVHWYKQTPGHMVEMIALIYKSVTDVGDYFKDERFNFTLLNNQHQFTIERLRKEDEAIYYCHLMDIFKLGFINGTFLVVNDDPNTIISPSDITHFYNCSVSLQCSLQSKDNTTVQCSQHHKVLWFRAGSEELNTGVMYNFTNNSCVYSLSKTIGHSSDTGVLYYCAVDTCGHVLFGDGTRVEMGQSLTVALSVLLSCCVLVIIVLCLKRGRVCAHCRGQLSSPLIN
uniref:Ig-like domain-containing protein n=1 Tax=Neogobius melanostomus TaxID=47308 RepID=A0A8C6UL44_9GOBI